MKSYKMSLLTKKIFESGFSLLDARTLRELLDINNERVFFKVVKEFIDFEILEKIERDKYRIMSKEVSDFEIANFLVSPSYISLETALNFWGILSQFPFDITSVTVKKSMGKEWSGKSFQYSHISTRLYGSFQKQDNYLIAFPEKALYDQLYMVSKGWRNCDISEYDLSSVNQKKFHAMCKELKMNPSMQKLVDQLRW